MTEWKPQHIDFVRSYVPFPKVSEQCVREAADIINHAEKPLALVGQGVELGNAHNELIEFLEKGDIPAGRTMLGLSALPSDHPLNVGMLGMHGNLAPNVKEQECDVIIAIGMRFSDRVTGRTDTYARQAKVIHLDIDKSEIDKNVKTDVAVVGDCKVTLPAITRLLRKGNHREWRESFLPLAQKERERVIERAVHPADGPLLMGEVVNAVAEATKGEAVLVTDVGQNQLFACRYFRFKRRRSVVSSGGLGTMGFAIPAAIGAAFGAPDRTICAFMGDGGLQMCIQELGTIMEQQTPVKMVLLNNNYLGNVRQWQDMFFDRRKSFTRMLNPRYEKIAQAYGIAYRCVIDRADLLAAIDEMLTAKGPFLLECAILEEDDVLPITPPGMSVDEMMLDIQC